MLLSRQRLFQGGLGSFNRPVSNLILHNFQQRSVIDRESVFDWHACSPDSPIHNVWSIMRRGIRQQQPQTVEQLKYCIMGEYYFNSKLYPNSKK